MMYRRKRKLIRRKPDWIVALVRARGSDTSFPKKFSWAVKTLRREEGKVKYPQHADTLIIQFSL